MFPDENKNQMENDDPAVGGMVVSYCVYSPSVWSVIEAKRQKPQFGCWFVGLYVCPPIKQSKVESLPITFLPWRVVMGSLAPV